MMVPVDGGTNPRGEARWRAPSAVAVAVVAAAVLVLGATPAGGQTDGPSVTVPGQRAQAEAQVDVTRASQAQVLAEIERLRGEVQAQRGVADAARVRAEAAAADAAAAQRRADEAFAKAERNRGEFRAYVTETFIRPPSQDLLAVLAVSSAGDDSHVVGMVRSVAEGRQRRAEAFAGEQRAAETTRDAAEQARAAAADEQAAAERARAELEQGVRDQQALAAALEERLERQLAEVEALRELDEEAARRLAEAEAAARSAAGAAGVSGGSATSSVAAGPPVGSGEITVVRGIRIHRSIAANLDAMLAAAAADGVQISGSGYRSSERQVQLRRAHCGSSAFDIYQKPSSQCSPPTARPGQSMHERGLAVDLTVGGRAITTRSSPAFRWLAANARQYGFFNLPSEPWHWSVNGR